MWSRMEHPLAMYVFGKDKDQINESYLPLTQVVLGRSLSLDGPVSIDICVVELMGATGRN